MFTGKLPDVIINLSCGLGLMILSLIIGKWLASKEKPKENTMVRIDNRIIEEHHHEHYHNHYQSPPKATKQTSENQITEDPFILFLAAIVILIVSAVLYVKYGQYVFYAGYLLSLMFMCINCSMIWFSIKNKYWAFIEPQLKGLIITLTMLWLLLIGVFLSGTYPFYMPNGAPELAARLKPLPFIQAVKAAFDFGLKPEIRFLGYQAAGLVLVVLSSTILIGLQLLCLKSWSSGFILINTNKVLSFFSSLWNKNSKWAAITILSIFLTLGFLLLSGILH